MQRRNFIQQSSLTIIGMSVFGSLLSNTKKAGATLSVNGKRIESRIFELAKFGVDEKGRGYRVAYTKGDIEGRAWFMELMKKAGLDPTIDAAGNIIGKRKGKNASLKPIAFGSHIDMVPDGGNYDGTLGSISALEVIEILNENNVVTEHPLEVIVFANEEGGTIGSMAMVGHLTTEGLKQKSQSGLTQAEGIKVLGGNPDNIQSAKRNKGDIHAWLELHIEQGGILEREKIQIGVVEGIVGIVHWEVTVEGFANQLKEAISQENFETMKTVQEQLQQALYAAGASVYQQAGADAAAPNPGANPGSAGGDDVIDAEFTETK